MMPKFSIFQKNHSLLLKIQRQQYRIIRAVLDLRQSIPICALLAEADELPLKLRFDLLTSRHLQMFLQEIQLGRLLSTPIGNWVQILFLL